MKKIEEKKKTAEDIIYRLIKSHRALIEILVSQYDIDIKELMKKPKK